MPERYNIAADVCDKHPRDKLAMVWERLRRRPSARCSWGELQDARQPGRQRAARRTASSAATGSRCVLPPTPETAAVFFGTWKLGAILLSMSVLYGDDGIRHRLGDSEPKVLVTDARQRGRFDPRLVEHVLILDDGCSPARADRLRRRDDTAADDPAQLYYTSGTTGLAKGIVHAHRYLLAHEEFVYCHDVQDGERFHGMGEWAWAAGIAPLLGPWRYGAVQFVYQREGGFDPHKQLDFLSRHEVDERLHDADGDALDDGDRGRRRALPAEVPHRLLGRRAAEPGGDPLVPRAVRAHGARLLRADRVLSAVRQLPVHGGPRGLDGPADARLGRADPRRGRAARWRRASAARSACARARTRTTRSATGATPEAARGDLRRRLVPHQGRRAAWTRTATSGTRAAPTT